MPAETFIIMSDMNNLKFRHHAKDVKIFIQNIIVPNIRLVSFPMIQGQAISRNVGANLSTQPYISFFDGDDYIHPQRFEILHHIFLDRPEVHLVLHTFTPFVNNIPLIENITAVNFALFPYDVHMKYRQMALDGKYIWQVFTEIGSNLHNGWSTMEKKVWRAVPQLDVFRAEDSVHVRDIVVKGFNVIVVGTVLGFYRRTKAC